MSAVRCKINCRNAHGKKQVAKIRKVRYSHTVADCNRSENTITTLYSINNRNVKEVLQYGNN